jgi:hypothetical protein
MESKRYSKAGYVNKIVDWFCERGWFELSQGNCQGAFCVALLASPDLKMVAKISQAECDGLVDLYPDYAKWVCTQNNPHFPKIYSARSLRCYDLFITIMERLDHVNIERISEAMTYGGRLNPAMLSDVDNHAKIVVQCANKQNWSEVVGLKIATLTKAVTKMVETFGNPNDLHLGNVMRRGNTLVITDPLTFRGEPSWIDGQEAIPVYSVSYSNAQVEEHTCNCPICQANN